MIGLRRMCARTKMCVCSRLAPGCMEGKRENKQHRKTRTVIQLSAIIYASPSVHSISTQLKIARLRRAAAKNCDHIAKLNVSGTLWTSNTAGPSTSVCHPISQLYYLNKQKADYVTTVKYTTATMTFHVKRGLQSHPYLREIIKADLILLDLKSPSLSKPLDVVITW